MSAEERIGALTEAVNNLKSEVTRNSDKLDTFLGTYAAGQVHAEARLTALEVTVKHLSKYGPHSLRNASTGLKITFTLSTGGGLGALLFLVFKFIFGG